MELEQLKIYTMKVDGTCEVFRPGSPIVISEFVYSAARMGTATLTATVRDWECLDGKWGWCEDGENRGTQFIALDEGSLSGLPAVAASMEKFFLLNTPSSSKSNEDERYVHTLEFVSERDVTLSNVYFCDAVSPDAATVDRYQSNNFDVTFFGTLSEFVGRFNDVLAYGDLDDRFSVVIDATAILVDGVEYAYAGPSGDYYAWDRDGERFYTTTMLPEEDDPLYVRQGGSYVASGDVVDQAVLPSDEIVEVSFQRKTLFEALQAAYEAYKVPFWFRGDEVHFGEGSTLVPEVTFEYGGSNELLSISKNNTGAMVVTRCTGIGGDTNIPYYYPNPTPKGTVGIDSSSTASGVTVTNQLLFATKVGLDDTLTYNGGTFTSAVTGMTVNSSSVTMPATVGPFYARGNAAFDSSHTVRVPVTFTVTVDIADLTLYGRQDNYGLRFSPVFYDKRTTTESAYNAAQIELDGVFFTLESITESGTPIDFITSKTTELNVEGYYSWAEITQTIPTAYDIACNTLSVGPHTLTLSGYVSSTGASEKTYGSVDNRGQITVTMSADAYFADPAVKGKGWVSSATGQVFWPLSSIGLAMSGTPEVGDTIVQTQTAYIRPSQNLMPPNYRSTGGADRWYEAYNDTYALPLPAVGYYEFSNEYNPLSPREHIEEFPDIYPSIRNSNANYFDAVYFEDGYNTRETVSTSNGDVQKYTYFFAKLHPLGFNLFDCAIEGSDMTVEMLEGNCASCKFKILVDSTTHKNCVQVNGSGNLVVGSDGRVVISGTPQDAQNDTTSNSVWVCLGVDSTTYGDSPEAIMPNDRIRPTTDLRDGVEVSSGDHYVLTGIALPDAYFTQAEEALKHAILEFMAENNAEKFSYSVKFSRIYLAHNPDIRASLSEHASLYLRYAGNTLEAPLHVKNYTYRQVEGEPLPEIDVELSDTIDSSSGGLARTIAASVRDIVNVVYSGGSYGSGMGQSASDKRYLRKDVADNVPEELTFIKGWRTDGYVSGLIGGALSVGSDGKARMEVDSLVVRDGIVGSAGGGGGDSLLEIVEYDATNHKYAAKLKNSAYYGTTEVTLDGIYTDGFVSAGGINSNSGGGGGGSSVSWTQIVTTGTQIATITINGVSTDVYAPAGGGGGGTVGTLDTNNTTAQTVSASESFSGTIKLHKVSKTGSYTDLLNRPTIPAAQIQSDWSQTNTSALDYIKNKPASLKNPYALSFASKSYDGSAARTIESSDLAAILGYTPYDGTTNPNGYIAAYNNDNKLPAAYVSGLATVATSGSYNDLSNRPSIPTVNNATLTIRMNNSSKGTFTANASSNVTIDLGTGYVDDGAMEAYVDGIVAGYQPLMTPGVDYVEPSTLSGYQLKVPATGSSTRPVYVSSAGTFTQGSTYAGGTKVTLNKQNKGGAAASFYAPTDSGNSGQLLLSGGDGVAPSWSDYSLDIICKSSLGNDADLNRVYDTTLENLRGKFSYYAYVGKTSGNVAGIHGFPASNNANALLTIGTYSASDVQHLYQVGLSSNGSIYFRNGYAESVGGSWQPAFSNAGNWNRIVAVDHEGKWYPDKDNYPNVYIRWDATNHAFEIHGDMYATGNVAAGGIISNS